MKEKFVNMPFPHIELNNFLDKVKAVQLLKAVTKLKFKHIESDLFSFLQTEDLNNVDNIEIQNFIRLLKSKELREQVSNVTGVKISEKIDLFASCYNSTHYLLPHDDRLEGRKIAFFYYLSTVEEGGDLCFYERDKIVKRIRLKFNKFAFFVVSDKSIHQVEEVVKGQRIALSGWWH
tara:strand:+ start:53072 stop:53602 length:531 start_codon:yes stop_codon:yes gene_type:complete